MDIGTLIEAVGGTRMRVEDAPTAVALADAEVCRLAAGGSRTCLHAPTWHGWLVAAAWRPGLVVCPQCAPMLRPRRGTEFACDLCGTDNPGDCQPAAVAAGRLLLVYGACGDCLGSAR